MLTAETLREQIRYDPLTGEFHWLRSTQGHLAGALAGCIRKPYRVIGVDGRLYRAHRLAWLYVTGEWPACNLDHIDRDDLNNRFSNLRLATQKQNCENSSLRSDNVSGVKGVRWFPRTNKWAARIFHNGTEYHLGYHESLIDAVAARLAGQRQLFTHAPLQAR